MTKYELLNILYAERNRVEKQCSQPGWTLWAIVAALAPISWKAWQLAEKCEQWEYVILVFNLCYFFVLILELCKFSFQSWVQIPIWHKGDVKSGIQSFCGMVLGSGFIAAQLIIIPQTFHPVLYWFAFAGTVLITLMAIITFIATFVGYLPLNKGWWNTLLAIPFLPTIALLILYLIELGYEPLSLRLGVLLFAIFYLLSILPIGEKKKFAKIDVVITKVLYDFESVDENTVLRKLERQVIGLRYGRYLSEQRITEYYASIIKLIACAKNLSESIKQGDREQIDANILEGEGLFRKVSGLITAMATEIKRVYNPDNVDSSILSLLYANVIGAEAVRFWTEITEIKKEIPQNLEERIKQAYESTVGKPKVQKMINDAGLWDVERYRMFNETDR